LVDQIAPNYSFRFLEADGNKCAPRQFWVMQAIPDQWNSIWIDLRKAV
jgi:hypothetical protein